MSDVARTNNDRFQQGVSGRDDCRNSGVASSRGRSPAGSREVPALAGRVAGVARDRAADLIAATAHRPGACALFPWIGTTTELISDAIEDRRVVVTHLRAACMAERRRGEARHWSYSKARHSALYRLYMIEVAELEALEVA